jgi:protein-L-isoaspartate(D-aspartate) O-methyltransferase
MQDTFRDKGLRKKLIETLREKGITDEQVLAAMNKVPRHFFMDSSFINFAYKDQAFPISSGQTISQPYTVAFQSSLLQIQPGDRVLEIGTGSGYQAAILMEMGAIVYSIERHRDLFLLAGKILNAMSYHPYLFWDDGYEGKSSYAPFDKILLTAAAPYIPNVLKNQLKIAGLLVAPLGEGNIQRMIRLIKASDNHFITEEHGNFSFVPFLPGKT